MDLVETEQITGVCQFDIIACLPRVVYSDFLRHNGIYVVPFCIGKANIRFSRVHELAKLLPLRYSYLGALNFTPRREEIAALSRTIQVIQRPSDIFPTFIIYFLNTSTIRYFDAGVFEVMVRDIKERFPRLSNIKFPCDYIPLPVQTQSSILQMLDPEEQLFLSTRLPQLRKIYPNPPLTIFPERTTYYSFQELINDECLDCAYELKLCTCLKWNSFSWEKFQQCWRACDTYLQRSDSRCNELYKILSDWENQLLEPREVVAVTGFRVFGQTRFLSYSEAGLPKHAQTFNPLHAADLFSLMLHEPLFLYGMFFIQVEDIVSQEATDDSDTDSSEEVPKDPKPSKNFIKNLLSGGKSDSEKLRVQLNKINMHKSDGKPKTANDFDKMQFKYLMNRYVKCPSKPNAIQVPECMKIVFAKEEMKTTWVQPFGVSLSSLGKINLIQKFRFISEERMALKDDMDHFAYDFCLYLMRCQSISSTIEAMYARWKLGFYKDRRVWFNLALLSRRKDMPNIIECLSKLDIYNPYLTRYTDSGKRFEKFIGCKTSVHNMGDKRLYNYSKFILFFHEFRNFLREASGMRARVVHLSPNVFLRMFLQECTTYYLTSTTKYGEAFEKISNLDVNAINETVSKAKHALESANVTLDGINQAVRSLDLNSLNHIAGTVASVVNRCDSFLNFITTPAFDKIFDFMVDYLKFPNCLIEDVRKNFTPLNISIITWLFITYQNTESVLIRMASIVGILRTLGLFEFGMKAVSEFTRGFLQWCQPDNEPIPTSGYSLTSVITCIMNNSSKLIYGIYGGICTLFKVKVTWQRLRWILKSAGDFGRDLNFSSLGLGALPKIFTQVVGGFRAIVSWLFGSKTTETEYTAWHTDFDSWRVLLHVLEDPRIVDLLRINEEARKHVDDLYDTGIKLLTRARNLKLRQPAAELARLMTRARSMLELIQSYRSYSSSRITPYSICLTSEAGIGKTNLIHVFKHIFHRFVYPDIDPESLIYNVPLDADHMDGYCKQKIMVCDDYNLIDDPSWVAKLAPLVSNVPRVLPMAHLLDKGIVQESDIVIKTTNNAYHIPNGVTHAAATLRRNNVVVHVTTRPENKVGGKVNKDAILRNARRDLNLKSLDELKTLYSGEDKEILSQGELIEKLAMSYYENMEYYNFIIKDVMVNKVIRTLPAREFFTFIVSDFYKHRTAEQELLQRNATPPVDVEEIQNLTGMVKMVDTMRSSILQNKQRIQQALDDVEEITASDGVLYSTWLALKRLSPDRIREILDEPTNFLKQSYDSMKGYIYLCRLNNHFVTRMQSSITSEINRILSRIKEGEDSVEPEVELPDFVETDVEPPLEAHATMFRWPGFRNLAPNSPPSEMENAPSTGGIVPGTEGFRYFIDMHRHYYEEMTPDGDDVDPRYGWLQRDFFMSVLTSGTPSPYERPPGYTEQLVPLGTRIATDFLMRLRVEGSNPFYETLDGEVTYSPDFVEANWYLHYPDGPVGVGQWSDEKTKDWFLESMSTFVNISEQTRWSLLSTLDDIKEHYIDIKPLVIRLHTQTVERRANRESIWRRVMKAVGQELLVCLLSLLMSFLYIMTLMGIAALFLPHSTATRYQVDPRKASSKLSWKPTAGTDLLLAVRRKLGDNMCLVGRSDETSTHMYSAQAFYVHGTWALMPRHFFKHLNEQTVFITSPEFPNLENCPAVCLSPSDFIELNGKDSILVKLSSAARCWKSAIKYFVRRPKNENFINKNIRIYQRCPDTYELLFASTTIIGKSDIRIPELKTTLSEFIYEGGVEVGTSGGPVFLVDPKEPGCILGVQSASTSSWGCFSPIYREDLEEALERQTFWEDPVFDQEVYETERVQTMSEAKIQQTPIDKIFKNTLVIGIQDPIRSPGVMSKTSFRPTAIATHLPKSEREPAILSDLDTRRALFMDAPHYLSKSLNKYTGGLIAPLSQSELDIIVKAVSTFMGNTGAFANLRTLTIEEAITAKDLDANSLDLTTSPGIPWNLMKLPEKGKNSLIKRFEDGEVEWISPELKEASETVLEKLRSNIVPFYLQNDFMKDELRDASLGKQNTTRVVTCLPVHVTLVARRLMLDYHSRLHTLAKRAFYCAVGVNLESRTSQLMLQKICSLGRGENCFHFDVSNWDGHFPEWLGRAIVMVRNSLYAQSSYFEQRDNVARSLLNLSMIYGYVQIGRIVYRKFRGMSSGFCGTAEDNTEGHFIIVYIIWRMLCRKMGRPDMMAFNVFQANVVVFIYGDDIIYSVSDDVIPWFNGLTVADCYEKIGYPVTSAVKGDVIQERMPWTELVFLKRRFVLDLRMGVVLTPLDLETIRSLFVWQRGSDKEQLYSNIHDAARFLVHHGRERFEDHMKVIWEALKQANCRQVYDCYDDLLEVFLLNYSTV